MNEYDKIYANIANKIEKIQSTTPLSDPNPQTISIQHIIPYKYQKIWQEKTADIQFSGWQHIEAYSYLDVAFSSGDIVFVKAKSLKGILERVGIRTLLTNHLPQELQDGSVPHKSSFSSMSRKIIYIDSLKGRWHENELISHSQALENALIYWEKRLNDLQKHRFSQ